MILYIEKKNKIKSKNLIYDFVYIEKKIKTKYRYGFVSKNN